MVEMTILASVFFVISVVMGCRMWRLKKDIYDFTSQLEQNLDAMASEKDIEVPNEPNDTLMGKMYEKLQRLNHIWKMKHVENLAEKNNIKELISDISHQTKIPIANVKLYLEIMKEEEVSERSKEFLQKMEVQTDKLDFLLQGMVKMSRLETGIITIHQQKDFLYDTLGQAVASIVPKAEKKQIQIYVECEEEMTVNHDKKWTQEAVFNILDNAVKYTESQGSIWITVVKQEIFTKISIKDSGKGIAVCRQAEIFTRFYREPEVHAQEGIGVGLYLARKILMLQQGYIEVHSEVGSGADFRLYLPNE